MRLVFLAAFLLVACTPVQSHLVDSAQYQSTMKRIQKQVNSNWVVLALKEEELQNLKPMVVRVDLDRKGNLDRAYIIQSSGNGIYDNSLLRAIRKSFPINLTQDEINAFRSFEFEYKPAF